jgi:hypothetical protein
MTNEEAIENLRYCIASATENIAKAEKLGLKDMVRRQRRSRAEWQAALDNLTR